MTITETRRRVDWDKERRKKRRRRLDTVDAGLVLVAAVLLGVGSHLFTDSLFRSHTVAAVVPETLPSSTLPGTEGPIDLALTPGIDGVITDHRTVSVTGTATPGATVSIGGLRSTSRSDGSWAITVLLTPGVNDLTVDAASVDGSTTARKLTITYQPSDTTTVAVVPTIGTTPTTAAPTTAATAAVPATTAAAPPTTRAKRATTTVATTPTTAPPPTTTVPVDTEPKP